MCQGHEAEAEWLVMLVMLDQQLVQATNVVTDWVTHQNMLGYDNPLGPIMSNLIGGLDIFSIFAKKEMTLSQSY